MNFLLNFEIYASTSDVHCILGRHFILLICGSRVVVIYVRLVMFRLLVVVRSKGNSL
jgi:hypothetical protein